jgi:hypothetical protein
VSALGFFTKTVTVAATVLVAVVVVRSLPDIRRYLKIRSM